MQDIYVPSLTLRSLVFVGNSKEIVKTVSHYNGDAIEQFCKSHSKLTFDGRVPLACVVRSFAKGERLEVQAEHVQVDSLLLARQTIEVLRAEGGKEEK